MTFENPLYIADMAEPYVPENDIEEVWADPNPIETQLLPIMKFDCDAMLPQVFSDWIEDCSSRMTCPPDFIAVPAIVALGSVIGARCVVKPKMFDDWAIVPNLWGGIVGLPSAKKSPAIGVALKPLDKIIAAAKERYEQELKDFESKQLINELKLSALKDQLKQAVKESVNPTKVKMAKMPKPKEVQEVKLEEKKPSKIEEINEQINKLKAETPPEPILRRYKSNDATVEKLGEMLCVNPIGMYIMRDELVGLLASWEKAGHEGDRTFYLESWNGNVSFDTDRIGRGSIFIPNLCLSVFGGIQPDKLRALLGLMSNALANDGTLQRFQMLVYPDATKWEWRDKAPNAEARDKIYDLFQQVADIDPVNLGASPQDEYNKFPYFRFSPEAQQVFIAWSTMLHQQKIPNEDNGLIVQHLAKYDKLFPALALILHIADCILTGASGDISRKAAMQAAKWCEYLESHARRCYGLLADNSRYTAKCLANKIEAGELQDGFTVREVVRHNWSHLKDTKAVNLALELLEDEGWVKCQQNPPSEKGGRPTASFRINPKIKQNKKYATA